MKKNTINNQQNTGTKPYVPPSIFVQEIDPWALLTGTDAQGNGSHIPGEGTNEDEDDDEVVPTKSKYFYRPYNGIFEDY